MEAGIDITDMSTEAIVRLMGQQDLQIAQQAGLNAAIAAGNEQMAEMARVTREEAAAATEELVSSIDDLNSALGEMSGAILTEAENRVALADAQAAYNEHVKEGKSSTDELVVVSAGHRRGVRRRARGAGVGQRRVVHRRPNATTPSKRR